jgi:hypothetical protein
LPVGGFIPLVARANASGTPDPTSNPVQFNFAIAADTVNALGTTGGFLGLNLSHNFGGAATSGTHHAARFNILHNGTVDVSVGGGFQSSLQAWYTGSSTFTTGLGAAFAFNPQVILTSAASNYALLEAIEGVATSFMLGTPPTTRAVLAAFTGGTQQASNDDDGINFSGVAGEVGFMSGIRYGRFGTVWPIDPAGSLIMARTQANATGYLPPTAAYGMRFGNVNFTAGVLKSPGLLIDGAGTVNVGAGKIAKIATGISIDVVNYTGGTPTISAAGASYQVNDQLTGTGTATLNGGIYIVDTVSGGGNILTGHFLVGREPVSYGGAGPATIAMEGGHGNQLAVVGVTWTRQRALQIQPTAGGTTQIGSNFQHVDPANGIYNITSANGVSKTDPWMVSFVNVGNAGGAGTPLSGVSYVNNFLVTDVVKTTQSVFGLGLTHNIAPNGNSATGSRGGLGVTLVQVGSSQGGSITGTFISSAAVFNMWARSNLGGTASLYDGGLNGINPTMEIQAGATFIRGGSGIEIDTEAQTGTSYGSIVQQLNVLTAGHQVKGYLNENISLVIAGSTNAPDLMYGVKFTDHDSDNPFGSLAKLIYVGMDRFVAPTTVASNLDFGNTIVSAFHARAPYAAMVPLQATGITGATRLTSDGLAASSFIYQAHVTNRGTGFTSFPTITVTGGSGAVVNAMVSQGVMGKPGVFSPGTGVPPEATAAVTGGGGSGATVALVMAGNTMNFPINSAVDFDARVVMRSTTGEAICWSCEFGARMGATASTTAIIGAPTWTQVWATAGAAAAIAISNPIADTTLGAINITVTPSSLTWSGGGQVRMTKTSRI